MADEQQQLATLNPRIDELARAVFGGFNSLSERLMALEQRMTGLEGRIAVLEGRMTGVETRLTTIESLVTAARQESQQQHERLGFRPNC